MPKNITFRVIVVGYGLLAEKSRNVANSGESCDPCNIPNRNDVRPEEVKKERNVD